MPLLWLLVPPLPWPWLLVPPLLSASPSVPLLVVPQPPRRQDSMSSVWVRERIGRSLYTVVAALALMTASLAEAALAELLRDCQWRCRVKSGGAGGIIDWPSEYIVDVRLGERALCAEDP